MNERHIALATGLRYHVLEWGAGDHTVVLVHGFLDLAWGWRRVAEALARDFHVVAPDVRGHGDSDPVGAGGYYHFADYLADLDALLPEVARGRVSLVGHSMGGSICSYYAGTYPERIHKLALLEGLGPPQMPDTGPERVAAWLDAWRRVRARPQRSYADVAEAAARLRANDPLIDEALAVELATHGTRPGPDGRLRFKHDPLHATPGPYGFRVEVAERFWSRVGCPVLLIDGSASTFRHAADEQARRAACFKDVRHATIEGAAHMMQRHRPAELAEVLRAFLLG